ncbi:four helix bundle protein [Melioribacteraceae bacterium 4301-Me]|uniref:four helix bundle protein n=1 Tax=Pyranulibacter aquaticus TaxID=3163344 RepID=UPI003599610B
MTDFEPPKSRAELRKRLYFFTLKLIEFIDLLPKDNVSQRIGDELFSSGTSVISNYIEGQAAITKKAMTEFMLEAIKCTNEAKLWLALLRDSKRANQQKVKWFLDELDELSQILASLINSKEKL